MKLTGDFAKAINDQVTLEVEASIVYRQLAIEMDVIDLPGIAGWFRAQAEEEIVHANKFIDHMSDREAHARIGDIKAPAVKAPTALDAFKAALKHEQKVSESIRDLYRQAQKDGDIDSIPLLNWFVDEQLEEEATVSEIIAQLELVGNDGPGLLRLDREMAERQAAEDAAK
ncbi:ferritin [Falsarthrobacter nasiphocae]|uniref:Ferritin n=1 Tax=Falsarthrobacter nasiphocae TaxID=189863 RepID=A0AAE4C671_9MICC|nr:ferritin [Falsarthrobacter nasiphocae]MDR6892268.1 ferritin [Falsarthrobacter nasiphocae]